MLRQLPAELLGDFEPMGLGALGVIGAQVDVDEGPAIFIADFSAQPIDVIIVAFDGYRFWTINGRADDFALLKAVRNEYVAAEPGFRRVGRYRIRQVPRRRARHGVEAKFDCF